MIRTAVLLLFLLMWAVPGQAGTRYDMAWYLGLVTSDGGSTLANGTWNATGERGAEDSLQGGIYTESPENANIAHSGGGFALLTSYWYEQGTPEWVLNSTRIFTVGDSYIEYCGAFLHEDSITIIPERRLRFPRYMEVGDLAAVNSPGTIHVAAGNTDIATNIYMTIFIQKDGITLTGPDVPLTVNNCLRTVISEGCSLTAGSHVFVLGPGRGSLLFSNSEYAPTAPSDPDPMGTTDLYLSTSVTQVGTSASYVVTGAGAFTTAGGLSTIATDVGNLPIPTGHVEQAGGGTAVVPLF